jgi:hypothetical protein
MYDEVSHGTPAFNALQLQITEFFQIPADITIAYRPSKTNTTALQRTCKLICCSTRGAFVSSVTIASQRSINVMSLFALQTRKARQSTWLTIAFAWQAAQDAISSQQICNDDKSAPLQYVLFSTPPTRHQSCMAVQRWTQSAAAARLALSNCDVMPTSYRQCTVSGSCMS